MAQDIHWTCRCGEVEFHFPATRTLGIRCYCKYCRHFMNDFGASDALDAAGGVDLVHVTPDRITFDKGFEKMAVVHYTPNGARRWFATCCDTPALNIPKSQKYPYVSILTHWAHPKSAFAPPGIVAFQKGATGPEVIQSQAPVSTALRIAGRSVVARFGGGYRRTPFFDEQGTMAAPVQRRPRPPE